MAPPPFIWNNMARSPSPPWPAVKSINWKALLLIDILEIAEIIISLSPALALPVASGMPAEVMTMPCLPLARNNSSMQRKAWVKVVIVLTAGVFGPALTLALVAFFSVSLAAAALSLSEVTPSVKKPSLSAWTFEVNSSAKSVTAVVVLVNLCFIINVTSRYLPYLQVLRLQMLYTLTLT